MPTEIDIERVRDLVENRNVQLVEVLPSTEYEEEHLPGAINVPLKTLTRESVAVLDKQRPVIVYCWDDA